MVELTVAYQGELRCQATHGPSGNTLFTDAPVDNHGRGETFSPTDLVASALGACMLTIVGIMSARHNLNVQGAKAVVQKEMTSTGTRRIARLPVTLTIPGDWTDEQKTLFQNAAQTCPVKQSLNAEIEIPITFVWK